MSRRKKKTGAWPPPEIADILATARAAQGPSEPRKHHIVPASYLDRWAESGQIRVTDVNTGKSWPSSFRKAARETDFYRLEADEIDPAEVPPLLFEVVLSKIEDLAKSVTDKLIEVQPNEIEPSELAVFAWFLAFQMARGKSIRDQLTLQAQDFFKLKNEGLTDSGLRQLLLNKGFADDTETLANARKGLDDIRKGKLTVKIPKATLIGLAAGTIKELGSHLIRGRTWRVHSTPSVLVTSDEPVVRIGGPGSKRGERAGVATAGIVLFPLSPNRVLTMSHDHVATGRALALDELDAAELNREILGATSTWAFERPHRRVAQELRVPPAPPPYAREGPLRLVDGDSRTIYRTYRPTRWTDEQPPWPVARWW